jgi:rhodanese-related sulfurtransferase
MPSQIRPELVAEKIAQGEPVYLIDVRQPIEHDYCHLADSVLLPLPDLSGRLSEVEPPEGATIVVYCHHGIRSLTGAAILEANGFGEVFSMSGGIEAWSLRVDPTIKRY